MASTSPSEMRHTAPGIPHLEEGRRPLDRLWRGLDSFLSEPLRQAPPMELARCRLMTGAALFLIVSSLLYLLTSPLNLVWVSGCIAAVGYVSTLVLLRQGSSSSAPAYLLCATLTLGLTTAVFLSNSAVSAFHPANMLLPALTVYLLGPRTGFFFTLLIILSLGISYPLYYSTNHPEPPSLLQEEFWLMHISAAIAFLGAWGLGSLHSTARNVAETSREQVLAELREREGQLSSLIESTEDPVASVDQEGRLMAANSAMKHMYQRRYGTELVPGQPFFSSPIPTVQERWKARMAQVLNGERLHFEEEYELAGSRFVLDVRINPILGGKGRVVGVTLFGRDITARKQADLHMGEMHRTLVDVSRKAGMAEIATGVLHNVGNTLNSVTVATGLLQSMLRRSRVTSLARAAQLLREHADNVGAFLTTTPQGQKLPDYFIAVSEHLVAEREMMSGEVRTLIESVDHIRSIVSMQQQHARTGGKLEELSVPQLIDEAMRLHAISFERMGILIERDYADVPPIIVDRHKLLQVLVNLLSNARHAVVDSGREDKRLAIRVRLDEDGQRLLLAVEDNGVGVAPEHQQHLFTQGFTTKKTGHGFGLHISALAAHEMKGRLSCTSPGHGQGATFTLELPVAGGETSS